MTETLAISRTIDDPLHAREYATRSFMTGVRRLSGVAFIGLAAALATVAPSAAQDAGDPAAGQKVFNKCKSCHQIGETAKNVVGPHLNGIVGRHSAALADYRYSPALQKANLVWDATGLQAFVKRPQALVPGTKMSFAGISADRSCPSTWWKLRCN